MTIPEKFKSCFWDTDFEKLNYNENKYYIISRLYNKGGMPGIMWVEENCSTEDIVDAIKKRRDFHPIVANYLQKKYGVKREDMNFYRMKPGISWR